MCDRVIFLCFDRSAWTFVMCPITLSALFYLCQQGILARGTPKQRTFLIRIIDAIIACTFGSGFLYYRSSQNYHYRDTSWKAGRKLCYATSSCREGSLLTPKLDY